MTAYQARKDGRNQRTMIADEDITSHLRNSDSSLLLDTSSSSRSSFMASSMFLEALVASECETWLTKIARSNAALR